MLKTKILRIDERTFTVKELSMKAVRELMRGEQPETPLLERAKQLLQLACPELTGEMIWEMYPSELEEVWRAFEEVNASFLGVVRMFRLDQIMIGAMQESVISSIRQFVSSSSPGTDQ